MTIDKRLFPLLTALALLASCTSGPSETTAPTTTLPDSLSQLQQASYSIGTQVAREFYAQGLDSLDYPALFEGIRDVLDSNEERMTYAEQEAFMRAYMPTVEARMLRRNLARTQVFMNRVDTITGIRKTESGLRYKVIVEGEGEIPQPNQKVVVHYHATNMTGQVIDSSVENGLPITAKPQELLPGWREAVEMMPIGSRWKLYVPPHLGFGEMGSPPRLSPNEALMMEVELIAIPPTDNN